MVSTCIAPVAGTASSIWRFELWKDAEFSPLCVDYRMHCAGWTEYHQAGNDTMTYVAVARV